MSDAGIATRGRVPKVHDTCGEPMSGTGIATPDYAQSSACAPGSMETRAQALRKPVIPAKAGIHFD